MSVRAIGSAMLLALGGNAAAQAPLVKPAPAEDLRSVYASSADIAEGQRVAESSCARCHGVNGISATKGTPHLAGQRAGYLHLQLRAYQKRAKGPMESAVRFLRDDALVTVAAYYASLEPRAPRPRPSSRSPTRIRCRSAKQLSASCAGCHGEAGVARFRECRAWSASTRSTSSPR